MIAPDVIHDILKETRAILDQPGNWTKNRNAEDKEGNEVAPAEAQACAWCLQGALMLATRRQGLEIYSETYDTARGIIERLALTRLPASRVRNAYPYPILSFNDDGATTHDQVLLVLDDAVAARRPM